MRERSSCKRDDTSSNLVAAAISLLRERAPGAQRSHKPLYERQVRLLLPQLNLEHLTPLRQRHRRNDECRMLDDSNLNVHAFTLHPSLLLCLPALMVERFLMWRSQVVRRRTVNANIEGSNPSATVNSKAQAGS